MGCAHHWRKSQHQYKVSGNVNWSNGELFAPQPSLTSGNPVNAIAAGKSVPGRIQLFAAIPDRAAGTAQLVTCWQEKPNEESFFAWESMAGAPTLGSTVPVVAAHNLPDGRLQLWAYSSSNELFTCWKSGNEQSAPYEFSRMTFLYQRTPPSYLANWPASFLHVRDLRTNLRHDVDHGDAGKIRGKQKQLGNTFALYGGTGTPETMEPAILSIVQTNLLTAIEGDTLGH